MIDDIYVFDNIIDSKAQEHIKDITFNKIRWQYISDVTSSDNKQQRPGFNYCFITNTENVYEWHTDMCTIVDAACNKINFKRKECVKGRSFLQLPLNLKDKSIDAPHVDLMIPHLVVLYYVNDSEAQTIIYEDKFDTVENRPKISELKIKQKITPKQGRVVLFNGLHWHTAEQPEQNVRCIINYDVV